MPVQYKSIVTEHMAVRTKVGIFDVSHMGEFVVTGADAHDFVQYLIPNDINRLNKPNMALYSQLVRANGGTVDDLIVYRREHDFLLVVNASNIEKDWKWLQEHARKFKDVNMKDISDRTALLAVQGPFAVNLLARLAGDWISNMPSFTYGEAQVNGVPVSFGRTGYTGEDGFEIFIDSDKVVAVWNALLEAGAAVGIEPCGLGARDTLRLEAGLPLYGHELDDDTSPLEAGLGWSVKLEKGDFCGREALQKQASGDMAKMLVCLKAEGKALPRQGYPVYAGDRQLGTVTSGSQGIFVGYPIACAYVPKEFAKVGVGLAIGIRDSKVAATVVKRPFYRRK
jgi:aminomethyltransferase